MSSAEICMIVLITFFVIAIISLASVVIYSSNKHKSRIEEIMIYQINTQATIDKTIPEILDLIIQESFTDYQVKFLAPLNEGYINSDREAEIRKDLVDLVTGRISSATLDKLSLFYNIQNIANILADKIYITVMKYVSDHNAAFMSPET